MAERVAQLGRGHARENLTRGLLARCSTAILQHTRNRGCVTMREAIRLTDANRPVLKAHPPAFVERVSIACLATVKGGLYARTVRPISGKDAAS